MVVVGCHCSPNTMQWTYNGVPVSHEDYHKLEELRAKEGEILSKYIEWRFCPSCGTPRKHIIQREER